MVKDLATHTVGTVVQPGTVLLTLVPQDDILRAEVWVSNQDIGFVRQGQPVKAEAGGLPLPEIRHGRGHGGACQRGRGRRQHQRQQTAGARSSAGAAPLAYSALVALKAMRIEWTANACRSAPGMQASAEILLGTRSVLEYLLSPVGHFWVRLAPGPERQETRAGQAA